MDCSENDKVYIVSKRSCFAYINTNNHKLQSAGAARFDVNTIRTIRLNLDELAAGLFGK